MIFCEKIVSFSIGTVSFHEKIVSFQEKKRSRCEKTFKNINILLIFFLFCYRIHLATFKWKNLDNEQQKKQKERKMHMEDTSLKITGANKSFLNKLTNTISKILIKIPDANNSSVTCTLSAHLTAISPLQP